jgi:hypothetical protein
VTVKEELFKRLEILSPEALDEVLSFVRVLRQEAEALTPKETAEVGAGRLEISEGQWTRWRDIKRTDV